MFPESHSVTGIHQLSENRLHQVSAVIMVGFLWKDGHLSTEREKHYQSVLTSRGNLTNRIAFREGLWESLWRDVA